MRSEEKLYKTRTDNVTNFWNNVYAVTSENSISDDTKYRK